MKRATAAGLIALGVAFSSSTLLDARQAAPAPVAASTVKARELVAALASKKLEAFAVSDPAASGRYVAVLHVPGVQLLVVSAAYERLTDMDYRFYHKDYQNAYIDLRTGVLSKNRVLFEDAGADGLVAQPGKNPAHDNVSIGTEAQTFDGDFADPKRKNQKKISQDDYFKKFTDADQQYARLLGLLVDGLKKVS